MSLELDGQRRIPWATPAGCPDGFSTSEVHEGGNAIPGLAPIEIDEQDITIASFHSLAVDIHHIFPKAWCNAHGVDHLHRESIVNKTAISAATNRKIGGQAPSKYLAKVQQAAETTTEDLRSRLAQHHVDLDLLEADDFSGFFESRKAELVHLVGTAMGKAAVKSENPELSDEYEPEDDDPSDDDIAAVDG